MSFQIISIGEEQIPASAEIIRRSFRTVAEELGLTRENAPSHTSFLEDARLLEDLRRGVQMFGLFDGGVQTGFVALEQGEGGDFSLEKLAVLPGSRRQGGGRLLMDHAVDHVRRAGGGTISIGVIYENTRLLEWYRAYGFEELGTEVFPHLPFTVCFMRLRLDSREASR